MSGSAWFYVEPYVHISITGDAVVLYNTLNGAIIEADYPPVVRLAERLSSARSLHVVELTNSELADDRVGAFVQSTKEAFVGDLLDQAFSRGRPIEMMPMLHLHDGSFQGSADTLVCSGQDIMTYLTEMSVYINNSCDLCCPTCRQAYRQFLACTRGMGASHELDIAHIAKLVEEAQGSGLARVNIVGGDLFQYSKFGQLVDLMSQVQALKIYVTHYANLLGREQSLTLIAADKNAELRILVDFPLEEKRFGQAVPLLSKIGIRYGLDFIVQDESDLRRAEGIVSELQSEVVSFKACYNGANADFLKKALFLSREDILSAKPSLREIFARMAANPLAFGRLVVLSDGAVCASVNTAARGHLGQDSLHDIVYDELVSGTAWRASRTAAGPCSSCMYNLLCPPRTDYEAALGQQNLCHIRTESPEAIGTG